MDVQVERYFMLSVNRISSCNFGENLIGTSAQNQSPVQQNQETNQNSKDLSQNPAPKQDNKTKLLLGLGALAVLAIAGVLTHKKIKANKLKHEAIDKMNKIKANFEEYAFPCKSAGETIQESVNKTFGSDASLIAPHTYDKSKESYMSIQENWGGYWLVNISPDNRMTDHGLARKLNREQKQPGFITFEPRQLVGPRSNIIKQGVTDAGERFVVVRFPLNVGGVERNDGHIVLYSKDKKLTPAQKDLLKIAERGLTEKEEALFLKTVKRDPSNIDFFPGNYDSILSLIHTLANKVIK